MPPVASKYRNWGHSAPGGGAEEGWDDQSEILASRCLPHSCSTQAEERSCQTQLGERGPLLRGLYPRGLVPPPSEPRCILHSDPTLIYNTLSLRRKKIRKKEKAWTLSTEV